MRLSAREIRLIEVLLRHPDSLTIVGIADRLGVSARTVRRELDLASEFLDSHGLTLVRQPGRGLSVEGDAGVREEALESLCDVRPVGMLPEERQPRYETAEQGDEEATGGGETEAAEEKAEEEQTTSSR